MEMNYPIVIIAALLVATLLVWLVYRNYKDEKKLEKNTCKLKKKDG